LARVSDPDPANVAVAVAATAPNWRKLRRDTMMPSLYSDRAGDLTGDDNNITKQEPAD